jgi:hypothetical protein
MSIGDMGMLRAQRDLLREAWAENKRLRGALRSVHWHGVNKTVNSEVFVQIANEALRDSGSDPTGEDPKGLSAEHRRAAPEEGHRPEPSPALLLSEVRI